MKKKFIIFSLLLTLLLIVLTFSRRIEFEYYVWHLSSEDPKIRKEYADEIIAMGDTAIPMILDKLERPYIYETEYLLECISEISNIEIFHKSQDSIIIYWKNWAIQNGYD